MRYLLPLAVLAVGLFGIQATAAEESKHDLPKPIPADRHEAISRLMIRLQSAQLRAVQTAEAARQADEAATRLQAEYEAEQEKLRKEFNAPAGCALNVDKTWQCPPPKKQEEKK